MENGYEGLLLSVFDANLRYPRHRWYRFKQGFSKHLVETAIGEQATTSRKPRVLDPFVGSGTTYLSSLEAGNDAVAFEVNPFLAFVTEAKTVPGPWDPSEFEEARSHLMAASPANGESKLEEYSTFSEANGKSKWLFNTEVLRQFIACRRELSNLPVHFRKPLLLSLLAAALETSNVLRDGKCLRYKRNWALDAFGRDDFLAAFSRHSGMLAVDTEASPLAGSTGTLRCGDARQLLRELPEGFCELVVTSPPYLNSADYTDIYRPELFLGGFVNSSRELRDLRLRTVRSHVQASWEKTHTYESQELNRIVKLLRSRELWDPRLPDMVQAYFDDLLAVIRELFRVLVSGGQLWLVIGTSAYANVQIPVDLLLGELIETVGFHLEGVFFLRNMRSSGQHWQQQNGGPAPLRESLVIAKRP